jgi:hypothetical protein
MIFCESCNWKKIFKKEEDIKDLYEVKKTKLQKNIAKIEENAFQKETFSEQKRYFRCKKCSKLCFVRQIENAQQKILDNIELEKNKLQREKDEKNWSGRN